jgi:hypothetical protein
MRSKPVKQSRKDTKPSKKVKDLIKKGLSKKKTFGKKWF